MGTEETQNTETTEVQDTTATETAEAPETTTEGEGTGEEKAKAAQSASPGEGEGKGAKVVSETTEGEEGETPAFKPNYKFRVLDKEHEIDKRFHSIIKNAEDEKLVRELYEKAYGLDVVKPKLAAEREENLRISKENTSIKASIDNLRGIVQKVVQTGNYLKMGDFFQRLNIPKELVLRYAAAEVELSELPPDQQNLMQSKIEAERRAEALEQQNQEGQSRFEQLRVEQKRVEFEMEMQKDDVKAAEAAFNARMGNQEAFRKAVADLGVLTWYQSDGKIDLTPTEAIQKVIALYGLKPASDMTGAAPTQAAPAANGQSGKKVIQRTNQTIPNINGRSGSPLATKPRSIEDLKKLAAEAQANG